MKIIAWPVLTVLIPYLIFITSWEIDVQIVAFSVYCFIILYFFIFKSGGLSKLSLGSKILVAPTHILLAFALLNFLLNIKANVFVICAGFIVLTFASYIAAAFFSKE